MPFGIPLGRQGVKGGDVYRSNNELAFTPLDPAGFGVPRLPTPPPLADLEETLTTLADTVRQSDPKTADAVLAG